MKIYNGYQALDAPLDASVVAVGNFDGVHRGHREILNRLIAWGNERGIPSLLLTFRPHPVKFLVPHLAPPLINTYEQKRELVRSVGIDIMVEEPFHREYANLSPEQFVTDILHRTFGAKAIFVGFDFTFGRGGKANVDALRELGAPFGLEVHCADPLSFEGIVASSTKVRSFVQEGQVRGAHILLGRPFSIVGHVVPGEQRGRTIGFPTANLETKQELLPAFGVYACWAVINGTPHRAVTNIGIRPTFRSNEPTIEAHILDFSEDIYDQEITLHVMERLRAEQSFSSIEALQTQIKQDREKADAVLKPKQEQQLFHFETSLTK